MTGRRATLIPNYTNVIPCFDLYAFCVSLHEMSLWPKRHHGAIEDKGSYNLTSDSISLRRDLIVLPVIARYMISIAKARPTIRTSTIISDGAVEKV